MVTIEQQVAEYKVALKKVRSVKTELSGEVKDPQAVAALLDKVMSQSPDELLYILALNSSNQVLGFVKVGEGTVDKAAVYPRKIVRALLELNATAVILTHNHPGGTLEASREDVALTKKLKGILEPLEVRVLDHMIFAAGDWYSMQSEGLM